MTTKCETCGRKLRWTTPWEADSVSVPIRCSCRTTGRQPQKRNADAAALLKKLYGDYDEPPKRSRPHYSNPKVSIKPCEGFGWARDFTNLLWEKLRTNEKELFALYERLYPWLRSDQALADCLAKNNENLDARLAAASPALLEAL